MADALRAEHHCSNWDCHCLRTSVSRSLGDHRSASFILTDFLRDFPHTWKLLAPELKFVANRRMAIDAAEADVDEAGGMTQVRGMVLALTDVKVHCSIP